MELTPLFTQQRWNILKHLSREPMSPLHLAALTGTTIANISQQLRLLEAANLVRKEKVRNKGRGQPRALFSLTDDYAFIISVTDDFAEKKLVHLTASHKLFIRILSLDDSEKRQKVEQAYFQIHSYLEKIKAVFADFSSDAVVVVVTSDKGATKRLGAAGAAAGIKLLTEDKVSSYMAKSDSGEGEGKVVVLHDPEHILRQAQAHMQTSN